MTQDIHSEPTKSKTPNESVSVLDAIIDYYKFLGDHPLFVCAIITGLLTLLIGFGRDDERSRFQASKSPLSQNSQSAESHGINDVQTALCNVTYDSFRQLQSGMTYPQAVQILGCQGEEVSRVYMMGVTSVMYSWTGSEKILSNMNIMFQDGRLTTKAQFGLK